MDLFPRFIWLSCFRNITLQLQEHQDFFVAGHRLAVVVDGSTTIMSKPKHRWFDGVIGLLSEYDWCYSTNGCSSVNEPDSYARLTLHPDDRFSVIAHYKHEWIVVEIDENRKMVC